jgi:hypothetical protein
MGYLIFLAICSIIASLAALYVLVIASFEKGEKTANPNPFASTGAVLKHEKPVKTQVSSLIWTVVLGQVVGLYYFLLFSSNSHIVGTFFRLNALILLAASVICSVLTILNAWFKRRMVISHRLIFQSYSLVVAIVLLIISAKKSTSISMAMKQASSRMDIVIILYFSSVIVALFLMLWDGLYRKEEEVEYDYGTYFRIVIIVGMVVGITMLFVKWMII